MAWEGRFRFPTIGASERMFKVLFLVFAFSSLFCAMEKDKKRSQTEVPSEEIPLTELSDDLPMYLRLDGGRQEFLKVLDVLRINIKGNQGDTTFKFRYQSLPDEVHFALEAINDNREKITQCFKIGDADEEEKTYFYFPISLLIPPPGARAGHSSRG